ncbi:hypothetical protein VP01_2514g2 [Puccinia sorghi]|uniref:Uncharacterized protein n=1 Tax=Puccinia sorghi TaxID=27349 RepID=A0A0L6V5F9_9BASI|nr:hypothetical protein VP01_2514g2 [Puccinia sorghi]
MLSSFRASPPGLSEQVKYFCWHSNEKKKLEGERLERFFKIIAKAIPHKHLGIAATSWDSSLDSAQTSLSLEETGWGEDWTNLEEGWSVNAPPKQLFGTDTKTNIHFQLPNQKRRSGQPPQLLVGHCWSGTVVQEGTTRNAAGSMSAGPRIPPAHCGVFKGKVAAESIFRTFVRLSGLLLLLSVAGFGGLSRHWRRVGQKRVLPESTAGGKTESGSAAKRGSVMRQTSGSASNPKHMLSNQTSILMCNTQPMKAQHFLNQMQSHILNLDFHEGHSGIDHFFLIHTRNNPSSSTVRPQGLLSGSPINLLACLKHTLLPLNFNLSCALALFACSLSLSLYPFLPIYKLMYLLCSC